MDIKKLWTVFLFSIILIGKVCGQSYTSDKIVPDDYPVTNKMLRDTTANNSSYKRHSGQIFSMDKVWFTNDTLNQSLVFELYTDYHRLEIFHFFNNDIPSELIKTMELYVSKSKFDNVFDPASYEQKAASFNGFIKSSRRINQFYFTTKKGFKLGDKKEKAISFYGKPDTTSILKGIEKCEWKFEGDFYENGTKAIKTKRKRLAKDSFGYGVTMFFRHNKLIAIILFNDIP